MLRSRLIQWFLGRLAGFFMRGLRLTLRKQHYSAGSHWTPYTRSAGGRRCLFCLWHDQIVLSVMWPIFDCSVLTSRNKDGAFLASTMASLGLKSVRGSSSRGGAEATRQLIEVARDSHITITPDGPRGPRRELKEGILFLASKTGLPVVPCALASSCHWTIDGRWTDMSIPKPFSRAVALAGIPVHVPSDISRSQLADYVEIVQNEMNRLQVLADRILAGDKSVVALVGQPGRYPADHEPDVGSHHDSGDQELAAAA